MRHLTLRTTPQGRTPLRASFPFTERASQPAPPAREPAPKQTTPHMSQAADTLKPQSAPQVAAAQAPTVRTPNPRVLRARARLRAIHRRRFKESVRNK